MNRQLLQQAYARMTTRYGRHAMAARILEGQDAQRSEYSKRKPVPIRLTWLQKLGCWLLK